MRKSIQAVTGLMAAAILAACGGGSSPDAADQTLSAPGRATLSGVRNPAPAGATANRIDARLAGARGPVAVWVSLDQPSVAAVRASFAAAAGLESAQRAGDNAALAALTRQQRAQVSLQQRSMAQGLAAVGGRELARVSVAHNAIALRVDASVLPRIAAMAGVAAVRPVLDYQMDLTETVPYTGGASVQARGVDGSGVRVAVLDSGIDYTHKNLGGAGTAEAYAEAYGAEPGDPKNATRDGLFPTAKVVDGFDFVGEQWPNCPADNPDCRSEDDDPIDFEGHGTHVADIIAGRSADGTHKGMAPGASLVAVKVCSAVATSCNGIALIKAMDFALDPNGDGNPDDAVDVINMSLGSSYGQLQDDLTFAASNAVGMGVVVVASAGNSANRPFITGSPAVGVGVISVAQTQVPSATSVPLTINAPASLARTYANTEQLDFAPVGAGVTGDVAYVGRGCPAGSIGAGVPEDPYRADPAGKIVLIDRGACSVSLKVDRAAKAGATGVLIGLVAAGDAVSFSFGGGDTFVPSLVIQQSLSNQIKAALAGGTAVNASISPAAAIDLVGGMVGSSARGPSYNTASIKPEIGAPGASMSAEVGTGDGETAFGGTSGAAPMVSGAAALLVQAFPNRSPEQIKAMLMNSAETAVFNHKALQPGVLAPITRIGAGELRVDRAIGVQTVAWNRESKSAALSFGMVEAAQPMVLRRKLRVENFATSERLFTVTPTFRYADDEASGAVQVLTSSSLRVGPRGRADLEVTLVIDPTKLQSWTLNGGSRGGDGARLDGPEFDGYINLTAGTEKVTVPWHVLPRKAAGGSAGSVVRLRGSDGVSLFNTGTEVSEYDLFSLTGTSTRLPRAELGAPGDNFVGIDLRSVGVRHLPAASFGEDFLEFAMNTFGRRAHTAYPAEFDVLIDVDNDGTDDFVVFNAELGAFASTGQTAVFIRDLKAGTPATAVFFIDADLNSANAIFTVPMADIGVVPGQTISFKVQAYDNYFSGNLTDEITGMRFTPGQPRYAAVGDPFGAVDPGARVGAPITATTVPADKSTESGLLVMFRRNAGDEAQVVRVR